MANKPSVERRTQTVSIHADVAEDFKQACKAPPIGRSMNDTATRIIQWFNRQADIVKTAVTADVDRGMELHYAAALRRLADELEATGNEPHNGRLADIPASEMGSGVASEGARIVRPPVNEEESPGRKASGRRKS